MVHLASHYVFSEKTEDIDRLVEANLKMGINLLRAMADSGVPLLLNCGTSFEHYRDAHYHPVNLYAATKHAFQKIVDHYTLNAGMKAITLKLFDTYGPGDGRRKLMDYLISNLGNSEGLNLSPGHQKLNLSHIDDVCSGFELALKRLNTTDLTHESFAIAASETISIKDLVGLIEEISSQTLLVNWGSLPYRENEIMEPWSNYRLLPGWQPAYDLRSGIQQLLENG